MRRDKAPFLSGLRIPPGNCRSRAWSILVKRSDWRHRSRRSSLRKRRLESTIVAASWFRLPDPQRVEGRPARRVRTLDVRPGEHVGSAVRTRRRQRQPPVDGKLRLTAQALPRHRLPTLRKRRRQDAHPAAGGYSRLHPPGARRCPSPPPLTDGHGILVTVRRSKTNQEDEVKDVRFVKDGVARALRTLRAATNPEPSRVSLRAPPPKATRSRANLRELRGPPPPRRARRQVPLKPCIDPHHVRDRRFVAIEMRRTRHLGVKNRPPAVRSALIARVSISGVRCYSSCP